MEKLLAAVAAAAFGVGAAYYIINSARARKRDEKAIKRADRAPLAELPELITLHDAAGRIRFASHALRELSGYTTTQLLGRRGRDFVHEDDVAAVLDAIQRRSSESPPTRLRMRTRTGDYVWLEARFEHISSAEGEPQLICRARCIATSAASALELLERELTSAPPVTLAADYLPANSLVDALRESLKHQEFDLRYQPKVAFANWQVTGVEALLRWNAPANDESVQEIIEEADRSGLIVPLGRWVVQTAVHQSRQWRNKGVTYPVAVNISHVQLRDPSFVALMRELLAQDRQLTQYLQLEVTGLALNANDDVTVESLAQLASLGFKLHVDGFRTGVSNFSQLSRLPVSALKVDRHLVQGLSRQRDGSDLEIDAISALSRSLQVKVIGEGVETTGELDALRAYGFDEVQGFLLARPMTPSSIEHLSRLSFGGL
jgi:PAS domain S-box-containing protein